MVLNFDGSKLSKRQSDISIESFRKEGIFPLAVLNYVTHAGGGFDNKGGALYIDSYEELIKQVFMSYIISFIQNICIQYKSYYTCFSIIYFNLF